MSSCSVLLLRLFLLVVATCSHAGLVCSDAASGYSIDTGNLKAEATKLSNGPNQEAWWQLGQAPWHDAALTRFFKAGPLTADEMQALFNSDSWNASHIKSIAHTDLTQALQRISMATYRQSKFISGTGNIEASMWTLLFMCVGTNCKDGYLVPIVIVPVHVATSTPGRPTADSAYVYATLWLPATSNLLVNTVPSFIFQLLSEFNPRAIPIDVHDAPEYDGLSLELNVWDDGLTSCPSTAVANCRTVLDGAYGLLPCTACIQLSSGVDQTSFNLLVSVSTNFSASNDYFTSVERFLSGLGSVTNGSWVLQPFEACSEDAVVLPMRDGFIMCYNTSCKRLLQASIMSCGSTPDQGGILLLKSMLAYMKSSTECQSDLYNNVTCQFLATSERCAFAVFEEDDTDSGGMSRQLVQCAPSNWTSTQGLDTRNFEKSFDSLHQISVSAEHAPCTVKVPSLSLDVTNRVRGKGALPTAIRIQARAYLANYIAEHNIAFNTSRGPPTDLYTFIALIVSTAFSVVLAISGHFTNFLLREICRRCPLYLDNQRGKEGQAAKVCLQVGCNVVLSMVFFLPVLSVAMNELERQKPFYTWDLGSGDLDVYEPSESDKLRAVYLLSGVSQYDSHFITAITIVVCVTCFIVAACTARRCIQIFRRYRLLKEYDTMTGGYVESAHAVGEMQRALRAIDMSEAEYVTITQRMDQRNVQPLEDVQALLPQRMRKAPPAADDIWWRC